MSSPIDQTGSLPVLAIGSMTMWSSSSVYPYASWCRVSDAGSTRTSSATSPLRTACSGSRLRSVQSAYRWAAAYSRLMASLRKSRLRFVSTAKTWPGPRRPFSTICEGSTSTTPTSEAMMTVRSFVTQ